MSEGMFCDNTKCTYHVSDYGRTDNRLRVIDPVAGEILEITRFPYINSTLSKEYHFCEVCNEAITITYRNPFDKT